MRVGGIDKDLKAFSWSYLIYCLLESYFALLKLLTRYITHLEIHLINRFLWSHGLLLR